MKYLFTTTTTMKEYNCKKWWIDGNIVPEMYIDAASLMEALTEYRQKVREKAYIDISDNAMRNKNPMYIDTTDGTKQVGYVITGSTYFEENYKESKQYVDLWVNINTIIDTDFNEQDAMRSENSDPSNAADSRSQALENAERRKILKNGGICYEK